MFESLNLTKAKFKIRTFILVGILLFIGLTIPAYFLLHTVYLQIDNPYFIWSFIALTIIVLLFLESYNLTRLKKIVSEFDKSSFVYDLQPLELVYLKTGKLSNVITGVVNELVDKGTVKVNTDNFVALAKNSTTLDKEQLQIISALNEKGATFYSNLLRVLIPKPVFGNIANCMDAFRKYVHKSKKFGLLFYTNFAVLLVLLLLSFTRVVTGILQDKPVAPMVIATIFLTGIIIAFLQRLTKQISTTTIPNLYKDEILPTRQIEDNWQWSYFLLGTAALTVSFVPLVNYVDRNKNDSSSCATSYGSSCASSCGSSCGSSCSSCGGCGD